MRRRRRGRCGATTSVAGGAIFPNLFVRTLRTRTGVGSAKPPADIFPPDNSVERSDERRTARETRAVRVQLFSCTRRALPLEADAQTVEEGAGVEPFLEVELVG